MRVERSALRVPGLPFSLAPIPPHSHMPTQRLLSSRTFLKYGARVGIMPQSPGCSAVWLARQFWELEVASSNLATPTIHSGDRHLHRLLPLSLRDAQPSFCRILKPGLPTLWRSHRFRSVFDVTPVRPMLRSIHMIWIHKCRLERMWIRGRFALWGRR